MPLKVHGLFRFNDDRVSQKNYSERGTPQTNG